MRTAILIACFGASIRQIAGFYLAPPFPHAWIDAHIYYQATAAWLSGRSPWGVEVAGIPFAAPPPALLLGLPFQLLGEDLGVAAWVSCNAIAIAMILRRLRLPLYWVLAQPLAEGFLAGSPDLWLAGLALTGIGFAAALTKPYSIPALIAGGWIRPLLMAVAAFVLVAPFLPWEEFVVARQSIGNAFATYTVVVSAFGQPVLMLVVLLALASLPRYAALSLFTPALLAQQPHYLVFSLAAIRRSTILSVAATIPLPGAMAVGVIAHAVSARIGAYRPLVSSRLTGRLNGRVKVAGAGPVHATGDAGTSPIERPTYLTDPS